MAHYDADGAGAIHTIRLAAIGPRVIGEHAKVGAETRMTDAAFCMNVAYLLTSQ